jgi:hypothetical protein
MWAENFRLISSILGLKAASNGLLNQTLKDALHSQLSEN